MTDGEKRAPQLLPRTAHSYCVTLLLVASPALHGSTWTRQSRLGCAGQSHPRGTHALHTPCMDMPEPRAHERKGKVGSEGATKKWPETNNQ